MSKTSGAHARSLYHGQKTGAFLSIWSFHLLRRQVLWISFLRHGAFSMSSSFRQMKQDGTQRKQILSISLYKKYNSLIHLIYLPSRSSSSILILLYRKYFDWMINCTSKGNTRYIYIKLTLYLIFTDNCQVNRSNVGIISLNKKGYSYPRTLMRQRTWKMYLHVCKRRFVCTFTLASEPTLYFVFFFN